MLMTLLWGAATPNGRTSQKLLVMLVLRADKHSPLLLVLGAQLHPPLMLVMLPFGACLLNNTGSGCS